MEKYDLTIVLPEGATKAKVKSAKKKVEKLIDTLKGKVEETSEWGEIDLAYPINKNNSGVFLNFALELEPERAKDIDNKLRLEEGIIRHLFTRVE